MRGGEDGGDGRDVDGLEPLEAVGAVGRRPERLDGRQVVEEAEHRRVLRVKGGSIYSNGTSTCVLWGEHWQKFAPAQKARRGGTFISGLPANSREWRGSSHFPALESGNDLPPACSSV